VSAEVKKLIKAFWMAATIGMELVACGVVVVVVVVVVVSEVDAAALATEVAASDTALAAVVVLASAGVVAAVAAAAVSVALEESAAGDSEVPGSVVLVFVLVCVLAPVLALVWVPSSVVELGRLRTWCLVAEPLSTAAFEVGSEPVSVEAAGPELSAVDESVVLIFLWCLCTLVCVEDELLDEDDEVEPELPLALAMPVPLAKAAPRPRVTALTPSQL
jgi:hypothetical protein